MNEGMEVLLGGFVGITDGKIVFLSKEAPKEKPAAIVDGSGMVLLPGLINCHTHLAQTALRNFFDDLSPKDSLEALLRFEAKMDSKAAEGRRDHRGGRVPAHGYHLRQRPILLSGGHGECSGQSRHEKQSGSVRLSL